MSNDSASPAADLRWSTGENKLPSIRRVLDDLRGALSGRDAADTVSLRELVAAMGPNSFPMLILLFSLLLVSPLSAIPGATSLLGLTIAIITGQLLLGRHLVWLPAILLDRHLPADRTVKALSWLQKPAAWLDRTLRLRQNWVVTPPFVLVPMGLVCLATLCAPLMEVIPASGSSVGAAISLFAAGLLARDGLFVMMGACLAAILPLSLWLFLT